LTIRSGRLSLIKPFNAATLQEKLKKIFQIVARTWEINRRSTDPFNNSSAGDGNRGFSDPRSDAGKRGHDRGDYDHAAASKFCRSRRHMANRSFRHMLIVGADERLHGVISDRDVLRALSRTPSVSEIMTRDSITTTPDSAISAAVRIMLEKRINCLPVIGTDGRVCGILTSIDLLKAYEQIQRRFEERAP
jgi:acetoin utilization protein AcuB